MLDALSALVRGAPVSLPVQRPSEQPLPADLALRLRMAARVACFEVVWSVILCFMPLVLRGALRGLLLKLPQLVCWVASLLLLPRLSWFLSTLALLGVIGCVLIEVLYLALAMGDYNEELWSETTKAQWRAAVGLYVAEIVVDVCCAAVLAAPVLRLFRRPWPPRPSDATSASAVDAVEVVHGEPVSPAKQPPPYTEAV